MLGALLGLVTAGLFGTASLFSRRGLERESFDVLLVVSLAVATPVFVGLALITTGFRATPVQGALYAAGGAILASVVARSFYFLGINYVGPGKSLSISATQPLYVALFAALILDESITALLAAGTVVIAGGVVAISRDMKAETDRQDASTWVVLFPAVGAVFAAMGVIARKIALNIGLVPIEAGAINTVMGLLVVGPPILVHYRGRLDSIDRDALVNFFIASLLMTAAFVTYFYGLQLANASVFVPLAQTQPLWAIVLSAIFLSNLEIISKRSAVGGMLVVAGAVMVVLG